jgi:hypothetical protein
MDIIESAEDKIITPKRKRFETTDDEIIHDVILHEEFLDDKFKLVGVTTNCEKFYQVFMSNFGHRNTPTPFTEIAEMAEKMGYSYPAAVQWMRMLWKAGKVRRFYRGFWNNALRGKVTGSKYGVAYYPVGDR